MSNEDQQAGNTLDRFDASEVSRVLVVVAHPDDAEYGISCVASQWVEERKEVSYFLLTSGEAGIQNLPPEKCGPLRAEEQRRACEAVGVSDLDIADFPDGTVEYGVELRKAIAQKIRDIKPDTVVMSTYEFKAPWGFNHVDHRAVGLATIDAIRDAANPWVFRDSADDAHQVSRLLIAGVNDPTHRIEVSEKAADLGAQSLAEHKEYLAALPDHPEPKEFVEQMTKQDDGTHAVPVQVHDPI